MRKKKNKNGGIIYVYRRIKGTRNNLEDYKAQVEKLKKDIAGWEKFLDYWKWNFEKAKKEYEFRVHKIEDSRDLMRLFLDDIRDIEEGRKPIEWFEGYGPESPEPTPSDDDSSDDTDEDDEDEDQD